jgi:hypothetical protein
MCGSGRGCIKHQCNAQYQQCFASFSGIDREVVMIGAVALCWTLWRSRNNSFFDGMRPKDPTKVIFLICHFLNSWAKLQRSALLQLGASRLAAVAHEVDTAGIL